MRRIFIVIVILFSISISVYTQTNMQRGIHVSLDITPVIKPDFDMYFNVSLFYRFRSEVFFMYLLDNTKTDLGIFNNFTLRKNISGVFFDSTPASFFSIYLSGAFITYYKIAKMGLYTFDEKYAVSKKEDITKSSYKEGYGFLANIKPSFRLDIMKMITGKEGFVFATYVDIRYAYMLKSKKYYYDYELSLLREKNDVSYTFSAMALFDYKPISVGIEYNLTYVHFAEMSSHTLGGYISYDHNFSRSLYLTTKLNIGQYLINPYMVGKLYFNFTAGLSYKI